MAQYSQTLAQAAYLIQDELIQGVAEDIITINPFFSFIPWHGYDGQAVIINKELTLGGAEVHSGIGGSISATAKAAATFDQYSFSAKKIIGDAEMDGLVQAQSTSAGVDQIAVEIRSKAKKVGRLFQMGMAGYNIDDSNTTGGGINNLNSLAATNICPAAQYTTAATTQTLSFQLLDELCDLVKAKDGMVDFLIMPARTLRAFKALYRALGGTVPSDVLEMPDGTTRTVCKYEDIPVFKNEYLSVTETANGAALTGGALTSVWAGVWDDGSQKVGVAGIYPSSVPAGIMVEPVGAREDYDSVIWRVKWYSNFVNYNAKGLARLTSISN